MRLPVRSKLASLVAATTLACSIAAVAPAVACADAMSTDGYVTAASGCGPNTATAEILGLSNYEENYTFFTNTENAPSSLFTFSTPRYMMWGTTEYNENPNPFYYNTLYDWDGSSLKMIYNTDGRSGVDGFKGGPDTSLGKYGTGTVVDQIWDRLPDVVSGSSGGRVDYARDGYAPNVAGYSPVTLKLNGGDFSDAIGEYWAAAEASNEVAESSGKNLRYGDSTNAAMNIERLVRGTQGYILEQLEADGKEKKTIASISGIASAEDHTYTLASYQDRTGQMRYLETVSQVANNIMDEKGDTVTLDDLYSVDMIILGGLSSTSTDQEILDSLPAELRDKCYYTASGSGATPGATYILTTRSPENFNNIGRILGCLYPEYVDQSDWVAYVFDDIYHIKDGKIAELTDKTMDGVRNWNSTGDTATEWTEADVADYNRNSVVSKLNEGMKYLIAKGDQAPETLQVTDNYKQKTATEKSYADVTSDMWSYSAIDFASINGLMSGYTGTDNFGPSDKLTRGQAALILCRYYAPDQESAANTSGMSDVADGSYYAGAVSWAIANGVMSGYGEGTFGPDDQLTREQLCIIVSNVAKSFKGADVSNPDKGNLNSMPDAGSVDTWAVDQVAWCLNKSVISGVNNDGQRFVKATDAVDRQTMAQIMMNAINAGTI